MLSWGNGCVMNDHPSTTKAPDRMEKAAKFCMGQRRWGKGMIMQELGSHLTCCFLQKGLNFKMLNCLTI